MRVLALLALLGLSAFAQGAKPSSIKDCGECIAKGYGWSLSKNKCGPGYANKNCPAGTPPPLPANPPPPPPAEEEAAAEPAAAEPVEEEVKKASPPPPVFQSAPAPPPESGGMLSWLFGSSTNSEMQPATLQSYGGLGKNDNKNVARPTGLLRATDMDEKRGDDDDLLALIGVRPKCSAMEEVKGHYMDLPYPPRDPNDELRRLVMDPNNTPVALSHMMYNGKKKFNKKGGKPFRILVAGGGTGDATVMFTQTFTTAKLAFEIYHVDLSKASINVAKERLMKRGLYREGRKNSVTFKQGSLLEVGNMGMGKFDFINCIGVLHHLESPTAGLKALTSVLKDSGAMNLMVYGELGRRGIYDFQDIYRILDVKRDPDFARKIVADLPETNWLKINKLMLQGDFETFGDSGVTDLLLHHCDHAYRVPEVLHWLNSAGMRMIEWCDKDNFDKVPDTMQNPRIREIIEDMDWQRRAAAVELLRGNAYKHMFYTGKDGSKASSVTEGTRNGDVKPNSIICRYDYFAGTRTVLPAADLLRCSREPNLAISMRSEIWNDHRDLPAGVTGPLLEEMDCKRTVKELHRDLSRSYPHIKKQGFKSFLKDVRAFYHGLVSYANSREYFITEHGFDGIPSPRARRDFKRVQFYNSAKKVDRNKSARNKGPAARKRRKKTGL